MSLPQIKRKKISDYMPALINPNQGNEHSVPLIQESIQTNGAGRPMLADKDGEMIAGSHSLQAFVDAGFDEIIEVEHDGTMPIVFKRTDLDLTTDPRAMALQIADNETTHRSYIPDKAIIGAMLSTIKEKDEGALKGTSLRAQQIGAVLESLKDDENAVEFSRANVPDALWPTDNLWGVPVLDLALQADAVDLPVNGWGSQGRKHKMHGTYHFYTDDMHFEPLWNDPSGILNAECINVTEPNFSTNAQMPRALVLWHTYRKRWLARYWQSFGIRIFVDLDVHPSLQDINLMGVPKGWKAYSCYMRKSDHKLEELNYFIQIASERAETDQILLLVVGGEKDVQERCLELKQCVYVPSFEQAFYRNFRQKTQGSV